MGYNKKVLSTAIKELDKAKAPTKSRDIITDPMGQWKYPGQPTRIPGNDITMQGVDYPVYGIDNTGFAQMMYPGQDYQFQGDYVDEYPLEQARRGGEKKYSKSLTARNKLFTPNVLTKKKKKNKKTFDPNAKYYQTGGVTLPEDYFQFQTFAQTLPSNLQDPAFEYGNPDHYNLYGMWETVGKPQSFQDVQDTDYFPLQDDGTYHGFTVGSDGIFLKPMSHGTTWKEVMNAQLNTNPYFQQNRIIQNEQGRLQYVPRKQYGGDISIPELTEFQEGGQKDKWGRSLNDKWYGFDPQTKKYTIAPYKIQELRNQAAGVSKYDPLEQRALPSETTQQAAKNLPSQKKSVNEAIGIKSAEKDATIQAVKDLPLLTEEQKNEILMDPRKLDEYSYLTRLAQQPDTVKESIPYSARERAWDIATNPFDAFEYSVRTGDISNMPRNYNQMRMAGIDPSAGGGANAVGNTLNTFTNLFDAGDKVVRNVGEGNYGTAALEAMRFIPSSGIIKPALGRAGRLGNKAVNYVGSTNVVYNPVTKLAGLTPSTTTASNLISNYGTVDKLLKAGTIAKTASYVPQASRDIYGIGKNIYNMYGADSKKQDLLQQDIGNRISNLGNMAYDTFLDYSKLNYVNPAKVAKYLNEANENPDDVVSDYKAVKYLSPLLKRQSGGLNKAQVGGAQKTAEDWPLVNWNDDVEKDQYLPEATAYANPTQKKLQGNLIEKLQQAKRAYNRHRENLGLDQRKQSIEGDSSIASLKEQIASYKKELDVEKKSFQRAQTALNVLKTKDPDNWKDAKLNDVMSAKGVDALRNLYSEGKISEGTHRDFYNNFGQFYDRETTRTTTDDQEALEESWLGPKDEKGRRRWMSDPKNVAKVANVVAVNAALGPAAAMVTPGLTAAVNILPKVLNPVRTALNYAPIKALPGLTANTAARAAWLGDTLINDVPETASLTKEFLLANRKDPDYLDKRNAALLSAAFTGLGLAGGKGSNVLKGSKIGIPNVINGKIIDPVRGAISKARDASGRFSDALEATLQNPLSNILPATGAVGRLTQRPGTKAFLDAVTPGNIINAYYVGKNLDDIRSGDKQKLIGEALADGDYTRAALLSGSALVGLTPLAGKRASKFYNTPGSIGWRASTDFNEALIKAQADKEIEGDEEFKLGLTAFRLFPGLIARSNKQKGGVANDSYVDTLSDKQIKDLIQKGYKIEYLD